jgi:hypothetical protein
MDSNNKEIKIAIKGDTAIKPDNYHKALSNCLGYSETQVLQCLILLASRPDNKLVLRTEPYDIDRWLELCKVQNMISSEYQVMIDLELTENN